MLKITHHIQVDDLFKLAEIFAYYTRKGFVLPDWLVELIDQRQFHDYQ